MAASFPFCRNTKGGMSLNLGFTDLGLGRSEIQCDIP